MSIEQRALATSSGLASWSMAVDGDHGEKFLQEWGGQGGLPPHGASPFGGISANFTNKHIYMKK